MADDIVPGSDLPEAVRPDPAGVAMEGGGHGDDEISEATRAAYDRAWAHFDAWRRDTGADPGAPPSGPALVAAYLEALAPTHGASALRSRVAAIAHHHRRRGVAFDSTHPVIREALGAIRRRHPRPVRPAAALALPEVRRLLAACPGDLAGLRDRAMRAPALRGGGCHHPRAARQARPGRRGGRPHLAGPARRRHKHG